MDDDYRDETILDEEEDFDADTDLEDGGDSATTEEEDMSEADFI